MQTSTRGGSRLTEQNALTVRPSGAAAGVAGGDDRDPGRELAQRLPEVPVASIGHVHCDAAGASVELHLAAGESQSQADAPEHEALHERESERLCAPAGHREGAVEARPGREHRSREKPDREIVSEDGGGDDRGRSAIADTKARSALLRSSSTVITRA